MGVLVTLPSTLSVGGVHARLNAALNLIALSSTPYSRGIRRCQILYPQFPLHTPMHLTPAGLAMLDSRLGVHDNPCRPSA